MNKHNFLTTIIAFVFAVLICVLPYSDIQSSPTLTCKTFDKWILSDGGSRFDYRVVNEDWNLPKDVEFTSYVTLHDTGLWMYDSVSDSAQYMIVFLSFKPSGDPFGQHDICVYRIPYTQ